MSPFLANEHLLVPGTIVQMPACATSTSSTNPEQPQQLMANVDAKPPRVEQSNSQFDAVLRPNGRKEYVPVVFSPRAAEWKLAPSASLEQLARLRSPNRSIEISGSQQCIRALQHRPESHRSIDIRTGDILEMIPRNTFRQGDLAELKLAADDVFHIENLGRFLLHVATHGTASTVTASCGGSMEAWVVTSSDLAYIEENPVMMGECKKAFWDLFRTGFVSTVYLDMSTSTKTFGADNYGKMAIMTMESRQLVQHSSSHLHPTVRGAMQFFQNISPGAPEETACPDLRFLWTLHPEVVNSSPWQGDCSTVSYLPPAMDTSNGRGPYSELPCDEYFSKEARAQIKADLEKHNSRNKKDGTRHGPDACFCILCRRKDALALQAMVKADGAALEDGSISGSQGSSVGLENGSTSGSQGSSVGLKDGVDLEDGVNLKNRASRKDGVDLEDGVKE